MSHLCDGNKLPEPVERTGVEGKIVKMSCVTHARGLQKSENFLAVLRTELSQLFCTRVPRQSKLTTFMETLI